MNLPKRFVLVLVVLTFSPGMMRAQADSVYNYRGPAWDINFPVIEDTDLLMGTVVFKSVLPNSNISTTFGDLAMSDIASFSFTAGPITINESSNVDPFDTLAFSFDSAGNIIDWNVTLFVHTPSSVGSTIPDEDLIAVSGSISGRWLAQEASRSVAGQNARGDGVTGVGITSLIDNPPPGPWTTAVPEPSSLVLMGLGALGGMAACRVHHERGRKELRAGGGPPGLAIPPARRLVRSVQGP